MIPELKKLTEQERELLFSAPVLVSVLASCPDKAINKVQKQDAIKLAHLKTFTANPVLIPYYTEVEKNFQQHFNAAENKYCPFDESRRHELLQEIEKVNEVMAKLDDAYAHTLYKSLKKYEDHVRRASHSVFQDFIIPLQIPGLND
jgi:hypothetical protein